MGTDGTVPKWLRWLERRIGWLAIPNIAVLLVTLQVLGFLMILAEPAWMLRLALIPGAVRGGEYWRLVTFLAMPFTQSPLWLFFGLWFMYSMLNTIEHQWGEFRTTLYVLTSIFVTIAFAMITDYPVTEVTEFESSILLAAAALFPNFEVSMFGVVPVKLKWLGWLTGAFVAYHFFQVDTLGKIYLASIYSNYLIFFGPAHLNSIRLAIRRRKFKFDMRR